MVAVTNQTHPHSGAYESVPAHPMQSEEWGKFQQSLGYEIAKCPGTSLQMIVQRHSGSGLGVGYIPRAPKPTRSQLESLKHLARSVDCHGITIEPDFGWNWPLSNSDLEDATQLAALLTENGFIQCKRNLFPATFLIDLTGTEEDLMQLFHHKTRYNIGVAKRHLVATNQDNTAGGIAIFNQLFQSAVLPRLQTEERFSQKYIEKFWQVFAPAGIAKILKAQYQGQVLASALLLSYGKRMYYPFAASLNHHRQVMAPTLMMWDAICLGRTLGCTTFDLWGTIACERAAVLPVPGIHRFLAGFGGKLRKMMPAWRFVV